MAVWKEAGAACALVLLWYARYRLLSLASALFLVALVITLHLFSSKGAPRRGEGKGTGVVWIVGELLQVLRREYVLLCAKYRKRASKGKILKSQESKAPTDERTHQQSRHTTVIQRRNLLDKDPKDLAQAQCSSSYMRIGKGEGAGKENAIPESCSRVSCFSPLPNSWSPLRLSKLQSPNNGEESLLTSQLHGHSAWKCPQSSCPAEEDLSQADTPVDYQDDERFAPIHDASTTKCSFAFSIRELQGTQPIR
eukprot:761537-Hanusia_phi.AAC.3